MSMSRRIGSTVVAVIKSNWVLVGYTRYELVRRGVGDLGYQTRLFGCKIDRAEGREARVKGVR